MTLKKAGIINPELCSVLITAATDTRILMNGHRLIAELSNLDIRYTKKPKLVILLVTSDILNIFRRDTFAQKFHKKWVVLVCKYP